MTELQQLAVAVGALIALATGAYFALEWMRSETERLHQRAYWWSEFVRHCKPLLEDADTPVEVLDVLAMVNRIVTDKAMLRDIQSAMHGSPSKSKSRRTDDPIAALAKRPELQLAFAEAVIAGFMASTYQSRRRGEAVRAMFLDVNNRASNGKEKLAFAEASLLKALTDRVGDRMKLQAA